MLDMLKTVKAKPKLAVFAMVTLVAIVFFGVPAALRIRSLEQLYRHPGIVEKLEDSGKTYLKERLGIGVPEDFELDISISEDNRVWLHWCRGDTKTTYSVVFMNAACLLGAGRLQQLAAYIVLDTPDSAAPYAVNLMDNSQRIFERMLGREIPDPTLYTMVAFSDQAMKWLCVELKQKFDSDSNASPSALEAMYQSDICDFEHFEPTGFFVDYQEEKHAYGSYNDKEIKAMISLAETFVSDVLGDSHSLLDYSVMEHCVPALNQRRGLVCTFSCGPEAESLEVYVKDNEVRQWYFWG